MLRAEASEKPKFKYSPTFHQLAIPGLGCPKPGYGAQWAGQGAPLARALPAAELIGTLIEEMQAAS